MTPAEIQARIDALEAKVAAFAGVRATTFADQSTQFDYDSAMRELARLRASLALSKAGGSTTRYAATSKGL